MAWHYIKTNFVEELVLLRSFENIQLSKYLKLQKLINGCFFLSN